MIAMAPLDQVLLGQQRKQTVTACKEDQSAAYSSQLISEGLQLVDRNQSLRCMLRVVMILDCYSFDLPPATSARHFELDVNES